MKKGTCIQRQRQSAKQVNQGHGPELQNQNPQPHDCIDQDSDWLDGEGGDQGGEQMLDDDDPELEELARRPIAGSFNTSASSAASAAMAGVRVSGRSNKGKRRGVES